MEHSVTAHLLRSHLRNVRDLLTQIDPDEIREIHEQTIDIIKRNRVFREGTIGGICCSRNRWSGIVQQHKKVLFGLP